MTVSLRDFERYHHRVDRVVPQKATLKELGVAFAISAFMTPFFWITFFVLPLMGQITIGFAAIVTVTYFIVRRSWAIPLVALLGTSLVSIATSMTIQAVKHRVDVPIFIFLVLGVPFTAFYCMFLGSRIWEVYYPED